MAESITIHRADFGAWQPLAVAIDGELVLVGDDAEAQQLHDALGDYLRTGNADQETISEFDPAWHYMRPIHAAIAVVREAAPDYAAGRTDAQIADSLRAAARRGTIVAASQDDGGNWYFRLPAVRGWALKQSGDGRGRPRGT